MSFYTYLDKEANAAKKILTFKLINSTLSGGTDKPQKCVVCIRNHPGKCHKVKTMAAIQGTKKTDKICPVRNSSSTR